MPPPMCLKGVHHQLNLDRVVGRALKGKTDAKVEAENIRAEIRAGRFRQAKDAPETIRPLTFEQMGPIFLERYSKAREKQSWHPPWPPRVHAAI
jgi:hypothetical protein